MVSGVAEFSIPIYKIDNQILHLNLVVLQLTEHNLLLFDSKMRKCYFDTENTHNKFRYMIFKKNLKLKSKSIYQQQKIIIWQVTIIFCLARLFKTISDKSTLKETKSWLKIISSKYLSIIHHFRVHYFA